MWVEEDTLYNVCELPSLPYLSLSLFLSLSLSLPLPLSLSHTHIHTHTHTHTHKHTLTHTHSHTHTHTHTHTHSHTHTHTHTLIHNYIRNPIILSHVCSQKSMHSCRASTVQSTCRRHLGGGRWVASQHSARADETRHSFDLRFYPTVRNHFPLVKFHSPKGPGW